MARVARQLELRGAFAAAVTPHRAGSQEPDFSGGLDLLDFLAEGGVQAICLFSETGEFFNYTLDQRQRVVYLGVKRSRVPIIAGVSHSTLDGAIQLGDEAIAAGADGLLLMPPIFFQYSQTEIEEFYLRFAEGVGDAVPILLHNLPRFASALELATVHRLKETRRFAGIHDSSGDWEWFERLLTIRQAGTFAVLNGSDHIALRALEAGADAIISNAACAVPELLSSLIRFISAGNRAAASSLDSRLGEFTDWSERFPFPVAVKRAVELRGQQSGPPLIPLAPSTLQLLDDFSQWFRMWLPAVRKETS
jgi:dihydrodipicolinate synthase/N-acetylneuraminate lyase